MKSQGEGPFWHSERDWGTAGREGVDITCRKHEFAEAPCSMDLELHDHPEHEWTGLALACIFLGLLQKSFQDFLRLAPQNGRLSSLLLIGNGGAATIGEKSAAAFNCTGLQVSLYQIQKSDHREGRHKPGFLLEIE